jgi:hypothetical protein
MAGAAGGVPVGSGGTPGAPVDVLPGNSPSAWSTFEPR